MRFLLEVQELQKKEQNRKRIVIVRCGAFFVGIGKDAVILHNLFNLKTVCISLGMCKIGIPIGSIEEYIKKLENKNYSFVIYDYSKEEQTYTQLYDYLGKDTIKACDCYDCSNCEYGKKNSSINVYQILQNLKNNKQTEKE